MKQDLIAKNVTSRVNNSQKNYLINHVRGCLWEARESTQAGVE